MVALFLAEKCNFFRSNEPATVWYLAGVETLVGVAIIAVTWSLAA